LSRKIDVYKRSGRSRYDYSPPPPPHSTREALACHPLPLPVFPSFFPPRGERECHSPLIMRTVCGGICSRFEGKGMNLFDIFFFSHPTSTACFPVPRLSPSGTPPFPSHAGFCVFSPAFSLFYERKHSVLEPYFFEWRVSATRSMFCVGCFLSSSDKPAFHFLLPPVLESLMLKSRSPPLRWLYIFGFPDQPR